MTQTREFPVNVILSVTTGRLLCDMSQVHELLDFMTSDTLFTHQLPRAADECTEPIHKQHPALADVVVPLDLEGREAVDAWLAEAEETYGKTLALEPLTPEEHTKIDPIAELRMMAPDTPVIVVELDEGSD